MPTKAKNKLLLPRPLSWSSMLLLESSPDRWVKKYLDGEDVDIHNNGIDFGKKLAEYLESEEESDDIELEVIKDKLVRLETSEMTLNCVFKSAYGDIPLTSRIDTGNKALDAFREYKTGRGNAWSQTKAQNHGQLHFYATLMYLKTRKIPSCWLDWIVTEEVDGQVRFTGNISSFEVKLTNVDILKMKGRITKNALKIDELVRAHIKSL